VTKVVVSFTLSDECILKIKQTAKALGMNSSQFVDDLIAHDFYLPEDILKQIEVIAIKQAEARVLVANHFNHVYK
jgi:hypothetical protein